MKRGCLGLDLGHKIGLLGYIAFPQKGLKMDTASKIGMKILDAIKDQEIADAGIGLTEAMSVFLAMCELHHAGGRETAKALLVRGIQNLSVEPRLDVTQMREDGLSEEEIRDRLNKFIPEVGDIN